MVLYEVDVLNGSEQRLCVLFALTLERIDLDQHDPCEGNAAAYLTQVFSVYPYLILCNVIIRGNARIVDCRLVVAAELICGFLHHDELVAADIFPCPVRVICVLLRCRTSEMSVYLFDYRIIQFHNFPSSSLSILKCCFQHFIVVSDRMIPGKYPLLKNCGARHRFDALRL